MSLGNCTNKGPALGFQYETQSLFWWGTGDLEYIWGIKKNQNFTELCSTAAKTKLWNDLNYLMWHTLIRMHSLKEIKLNKVEDSITETLFNLYTSMNFTTHLSFQRQT